MDVDELGIRGDGRKEGDPQGVPRLSVDPAKPCRVEAGPVAIAVREAALEAPAKLLDRAGLDVRAGQPVAAPLAVLRLELEDALENGALSAEDARRASERAEQRSPSRSRRGDDEYRPFDHGAQSVI